MTSLLTNLENFQIIKPIENGQFAAIYLIEDKATHKQYVAKVSKVEVSSEEDKKSFSNDIDTYLKIKHPAILSLVGFNNSNFDQKPYPTLIADFMANGTLEKLFEDENNKTLPRNLEYSTKYIILLGISLGMKYLHSLGIINRTLKPNHILLDQQYYPRISDYLSSSVSDEQLTKMLLESKNPLYIAPEVFSGQPYTYKSDVYSFSLIAYELVTGKKPYKEFKTIESWKESIINGTRPDLSFVPNGKIRSFLSKCWSKNPSDRPSFTTIADEIGKYRYKTVFRADEDIERVKDYLKLFNKESMNENNSENNSSIRKVKLDADSGNVDAMFKYASMLRDGEGATVNKEESARYFKMAADHGNVVAMYKYAVMLRDGEGVEVDQKNSALYFKKAADSGDVRSMNNYGVMLCDGDGVSVDKKEAARYIKMAADQGSCDAMGNYANMLRNGEGVTVNKKEAARYYKLAAEKGSSSAMFNYAGMLHEGDGIPENKEEEVKYIKMAADLGNDYAMYNYAVMLRDGNGVDQNKEQAAYYLKMCAERGNSNAMFNLANMMHEGDGIEMDKKLAAKYFKMAADLGNENAMLNYAGMLHLGDGIDLDEAQAQEYVKQAAALGNENAIMLCEMSGCPIC